MNKIGKGKIGEEIAKNYLEQRGYEIIEQNFRVHYGEIDLIARERKAKDGDTLVFIEVKSRYSHEFGSPEEAITPWKINALKRAVKYYSLLHPKLPKLLRIDVIALELNSDNTVRKLRLIKNAVDEQTR